ncbi:MAG: GHKL domain-containing protein [Lachnospiraceae bacterium]|nr:GHKL domain-containing protein [Lachnospiraceae bacterium]
MQDVLILRDVIWLLRHLGFVCLFFLYLAPLKPRPAGRLAQGVCFFALWLFAAGLQYQARITLLYDALLNSAAWFFVCLFLKQTHWLDALYGAFTFAIIDDMSKIISHDLLFCLLLKPRSQYLSPALANLAYSALYLLTGLACTLSFRRLIFKSNKQLYRPAHMFLLLLPPAVYFYTRNFQFVLLNSTLLSADSSFSLQLCILLILLGLSALLISILADNSLAAKLSQQELSHMQTLIHRQQQEFTSQKSASEAIQQKYHDLKNCLLALKAENAAASPLRTRLMEEIEQIMRPLEADVETGNQFLNIVLADKIRLCHDKQIRLTPYIDGRCLHFIEGLDLCVIVGNALDNAIEAVEKLPPDKREIHVKISRCGGMILLCFHNFYTGALRPGADGFYRTGKADARNHGYGLKGISQILEQYDGSLAIETTECEFTLNLLIPYAPDTKPHPGDNGQTAASP